MEIKTSVILVLAILLGMALGGLAGHFHGKAVTLEKMVISTQSIMGN